LLRGEGDLDGDGTDETLVLHDDGTLAAGTLRSPATLTGTDAFWMERQAKLYVVKLDGDQRAVVLELPDLSDEDPPNRVQLFVVEGERLRQVWDWLPTGYGPVEIDFRGDGRVQYVEDGWTACEQADASATKVPLQRVTLRLRGESGAERLTEVERAASGQVQDCNLLAACPMVLLVERGSETELGEILRGLRGAAAYDRQTLRITPPRDGTLHLRIFEHKPEVTVLDAVALSVDAEEIRPRACAHEPAPAYCVPDGSAERLTQGQSIDLRFDVPDGASTIDLVAWGHYIPVRTSPR